MYKIEGDVLIISEHYYNYDPVTIDWNSFNYIMLDTSRTRNISIRIKFENIQDHRFLIPEKVINTISFLNFNDENLVYSYVVNEYYHTVSLTLKGCVMYPKGIIIYDVPNISINLSETSNSYLKNISWYIKYGDLIKLGPYVNKKLLPKCIRQLGSNLLKYEIKYNTMKFNNSYKLLIYNDDDNVHLLDSMGEIRLI